MFFVEVCIYSPFRFSCVVFSCVLDVFYFLHFCRTTISEGVLSSDFVFILLCCLFYVFLIDFSDCFITCFYVLSSIFVYLPLLSLLNVFYMFDYYIFKIFKHFIIQYEFYFTKYSCLLQFFNLVYNCFITFFMFCH